MIFKKITMDPYIETEKRFYIEIWDKQIGQEPKLIEKKYFSVLREAIKYFYKEHGD